MKQFKPTEMTLCLQQDEQDKFCCHIFVHRPDMPNDKGQWKGEKCDTPREAVYAALCGLAQQNSVTGCLHLDGKAQQEQKAEKKPRIYRKGGSWQCDRAFVSIDTGHFIASVELGYREKNQQAMGFVERLNAK